MEENILKVDLNKYITKQIQGVIKQKDDYISTLCDRNNVLWSERDDLRREVDMLNDARVMIDRFKARWSSLQDGYSKVEYIRNMLSLMGIKESNNKVEYDYNYNIKTYLSYVFYDNQKVVGDVLLQMCDFNYQSSAIKDGINITLGRDFSKAELLESLEFVCKSYTSVSAEHNQVSFKNNEFTLDEIFSNNHILDDDVFEFIIEKIRTRKYNTHKLLLLPKYCHNVSNEQINAMFEALGVWDDYNSTETWFLGKYMHRLTIENQQKIVDVYGITTFGHAFNNPQIINKSVIYTYLDKLDVDIAIKKLGEFGWDACSIAKYVIENRQNDINNK